MRALRAFRQMSVLNTRVETGLVIGISPSTTPTGLAISVTPRSSSAAAPARLALQGPVDLQAGEAVLERLVDGVADPGLLHRRHRQLLGPGGGSLADPLQQGIDTGFGPAGEGGLRGRGGHHHAVDRGVDLVAEDLLLQVTRGLAGVGRGVLPDRAQHRNARVGVVAAQLPQVLGGQPAGDDVGVGVGAGRARSTVQEAELATACRPGGRR
jgi:hypothetical protein